MEFASVFAAIRTESSGSRREHEAVPTDTANSNSGFDYHPTRPFCNLPGWGVSGIPHAKQQPCSDPGVSSRSNPSSRKRKMYVDRPALELTATTTRPVIQSNYSQIDWDDVCLRLRPEVCEEVFWYQKLAFVFAISRRGAALLAPEAGLGKSYVAMMLIEYYASSHNRAVHPWPVLILVPAVMKREWPNKIKERMQLPGLDPPEPGLSSAKRFRKQVHVVGSSKDVLDKRSVLIVVCSYGTAKIEPMYSQLRQFGFKMCVCDESQEMRSPPKHVMGADGRGGSLVTEKVQPLVQSCTRRIYLTGTPSGGSGAHYQPQIHALRPDVGGWANYWEFGKRYGKPHLRMTSARNDVLLFKGTTNRTELHADLCTHVMFRLKASEQLRTEDEMAKMEVRAYLDHKRVAFRYTSDGLRWTIHPRTQGNLASDAPTVPFVFSKANHDMLDRAREEEDEKSGPVVGTLPHSSPGREDQGNNKKNYNKNKNQHQHKNSNHQPEDGPGGDPETVRTTENAGGGDADEYERLGEMDEKNTHTEDIGGNKHHQGAKRQRRHASVEARAHAIGIQGRVRRDRRVHWIQPPVDVAMKLAHMAAEEKELEQTLAATHKEWICEREKSNGRHVNLEHGSVDFAAAEVRQRRNELFRRTAMIKIKAARHHLLAYITQCVQADEKVVVMAYHRNMMDTCEGIIREALMVNDKLPRLTPGPSRTATDKSGSAESRAAWQAYCGRLAHQEATDEAADVLRGDVVLATDQFDSARRRKSRQRRLERKTLGDRDRRAILPYIRLDGSVTNKVTVQASIDRFQRDSTCLVGLLSIPKACTGITLTAGTRMVFAELTHRADQLLQAEARIDRRGQTAASVEIVYMLLKSSVEAQVWRRDICKMDHAAFVADGQAEGFGFSSETIEVDH
jgi:hypothetical protein